MSPLFDKTSFSVEWSNQECLDPMQEFDGYIYKTDGHILGEFDEYGFKNTVASFSVTFANVDQMATEEEDIEDIFDSHSDSMLSYYQSLYDMYEFREDIKMMHEYNVFGVNLFVIDRLLILSRYRGHGLGLKIMNFLISRLGHGAALVAIKPFPLQFEGRIGPHAIKRPHPREYGYSKFSKSLKRSTAKLHAYYGKIGFIPLEGTPYMTRPAIY